MPNYEGLDPEVVALLEDSKQNLDISSFVDDLDFATPEEIEAARVKVATIQAKKDKPAEPDDPDFDKNGNRVFVSKDKDTDKDKNGKETPGSDTTDFTKLTDKEIEKFDTKKYKEYTAWLKTQNTNLVTEQQKVSDFVGLLKGFEANPEAFALKYLPQYVNSEKSLKQITVSDGVVVELPKTEFDQLVTAKYIDETGKLLIELNNTHAIIPGTPTYNFNKVVSTGVKNIEEAKTAQKNVLQRIEDEKKTEKENFDKAVLEAKEHAKKTYGIEKEEDFKALILDKLTEMKNLSISRFVDVLMFDKAVENKVADIIKNKKLSAEQILQMQSPQSGHTNQYKKSPVKDPTKFDWE